MVKFWLFKTLLTVWEVFCPLHEDTKMNMQKSIIAFDFILCLPNVCRIIIELSLKNGALRWWAFETINCLPVIKLYCKMG